MTALTGLLVASAMVVGQAGGPTAEDYYDFMDYYTGEWDSVFTQGDEVTESVVTISVSPSKRCQTVLVKSDGEVIRHALWGFDPATKRWTGIAFNSDGMFSSLSHGPEILEAKFGKPFETEVRGATASGSPFNGKWSTTLIDKNNYVIGIPSVQAGDETIPETTIRLTRKGTKKPSNHQHIKEYGDLVSGRWVGDITLIADWPGLSKKKGEKVISYGATRWIADKNALEEVTYIGEDLGKSLHYWDPVRKKIIVRHVSAAGGSGESVIWKQDGIWTWEYEGHLWDGKTLTGSGTIEGEDGGDTVIHQGKVLMDGEELLPYRDVFTRVSETAGN